MTPPDSGDMHECRCGYHIVGRDAEGAHTWSKCKPDSGEREVRCVCGEDTASYASGLCRDCEIGICGCDDSVHRKPKLDLDALDKLIPESKTPVVLPLPLAQRILAALDSAGIYDGLAFCREVAAELRERLPKP